LSVWGLSLSRVWSKLQKRNLAPMEIPDMTKPDFTALGLRELVALYNKYTNKNRKSLFANKGEGVKAVEAAYAAWSKAQPKAAEPKAAPAAKQRKGYEAVIVMKTKDCPYLKGNVAKSHWQELVGRRTIGDYLACFAEGEVRSYARAWLMLFVRDGHVTLGRR
jgi:hypothetical protein